MDPQEMALDLDYGQIKLLEKDFMHAVDDNMAYAYWMCMVLSSVFCYLAGLSTQLNLHQPQISERQIWRRLKNFGIGILSIVLVPCGTLPNGFVNIPYEVFRDRIPNGALWFANLVCDIFWYGHGQCARIPNLIIVFLWDFIHTMFVDIIQMLLAVYIFFKRSVNNILQKIHSWFTLVPCCVPWFVKRPVIVVDNQATSELCVNSPFTGCCTCDLNFPKRPILVVDDTGSSGLAYG